MTLEIPLADLAPGGQSSTYSPDPAIETMLRVLESPKGLALSFEDPLAVQRARFRFYRARRAEQKRGNKSFDQLIFTINGTVLEIRRIEDPARITEL